jgi:hypothetical protein
MRVTAVEIAKGLGLTLAGFLLEINTDSKDPEDRRWQSRALNLSIPGTHGHGSLYRRHRG